MQDAASRPNYHRVLLQQYAEAKARGGPRLFSLVLIMRMFRVLLAVAARRVGRPIPLTPHMLRYGGASADYFSKTRSLTAIQARGRWLAPESVRRYRKEGRLLAVARATSP